MGDDSVGEDFHDALSESKNGSIDFVENGNLTQEDLKEFLKMIEADAESPDHPNRECLCLLNDDDRNSDTASWLLCKGCKKLFHSRCHFIVDSNDDRGWYCHDFVCQGLISNDFVNVVDNSRSRPVLKRNCKRKIEKHYSDPLIDETLLSNRVSCELCGFLAKNKHGLSIHMRKHKRVVVDDVVSQEPVDVASNEASVSEVLIEFGFLLNKCRISVPLTRIIQKSVRIVVCQELTKVIEGLVKENDVNSWMRLLAFPYIVLNNKSKGKEGINVIRSNLNLFRNCTDINQALRTIFETRGIPLATRKSVSKDSLIIKAATRKVSEGDVKGAVRVLCSNESVAPQTSEIASKLRSKHPIDGVGFLRK